MNEDAIQSTSQCRKLKRNGAETQKEKKAEDKKIQARNDLSILIETFILTVAVNMLLI